MVAVVKNPFFKQKNTQGLATAWGGKIIIIIFWKTSFILGGNCLPIFF